MKTHGDGQIDRKPPRLDHDHDIAGVSPVKAEALEVHGHQSGPGADLSPTSWPWAAGSR